MSYNDAVAHKDDWKSISDFVSHQSCKESSALPALINPLTHTCAVINILQVYKMLHVGFPPKYKSKPGV